MHKLINLIPLVLAAGFVVSPVLAQDVASDMDFLGVKAVRVTVSPLTRASERKAYRKFIASPSTHTSNEESPDRHGWQKRAS